MKSHATQLTCLLAAWIGGLIMIVVSGSVVSSASAHDPAECVCPEPPPPCVSDETRNAIEAAKKQIEALGYPNAPAYPNASKK